MSLNLTSQQEEEKRYFNEFCSICKLTPKEIKFGDKPDIVMDIGEDARKVGVEVTNFYISHGEEISSEQKQKPIRDQVLKEAQKIYLKNNGKKIDVWIGFNQILNKKNLAQKIAEFVKTIDCREAGLVSQKEFGNISEVESIYLNTREYVDCKWRSMQVYTAEFLNKESLQKIIENKERKIQNYETCDEYWLLIVINFFDRAQDQEFMDSDFSCIKCKKFKKIIIYKTALQQFVEL